jgi:hypothetical protein
MKSDPRLVSRDNQRQQWFVAPKVQGNLLFRVGLYCVACCSISTALCFVVAHRDPPANLLDWLSVGIFSSLFVIPLAMYDAARVSNRMLGLFVRVQRTFRQISSGDAVRPLKTRASDLAWSDWLEDLNQMLHQVEPRTTTRARNTSPGELP